MKHSHEAKFVSEDILLRISMIDRCIPGETIYLASGHVTVQSGEDPNPDAMLSGTTVVGNNDWIQQYLVGGLPGVVYLVWLAVRTSLGNVYIDSVEIAVLKDEVPAILPEVFVLTVGGDSIVTSGGDYLTL